MELHQLRYLVLLSEDLNFTRAAARGNVAQPALSRQIRKLEDELGLPLVDRTTRRVTMTPAGLELAGRARHVLAELDAARAAAQEAVELLTGRVAIGMTKTPGPVSVAPLVGAFHRRHPGVELMLREDLSVTLCDRLRADELDFAFITAVDAAARRRLERHPLAAEELVAVVARSHALAGRDSVRLADLRDERFIAFPPGATIRVAVEAAAARAGFAPHVAFESNETARTRALVAEGLGVAVLPRSDTRTPGTEVVALPLRDRGLTHEVFVAWRAGRRLSPAAAEALRQIRA
ncbi:MAG TPA: LysR family transcriptional regulator [Baekduia sp.]|nr:LysR family transcriptional regulator [Baekduia sp.]